MHIKINNITVSKDNIKKTSTLSLKILVIQSLKNKVVLHNIVSTLKKVNKSKFRIKKFVSFKETVSISIPI